MQVTAIRFQSSPTQTCSFRKKICVLSDYCSLLTRNYTDSEINQVHLTGRKTEKREIQSSWDSVLIVVTLTAEWRS